MWPGGTVAFSASMIFTQHNSPMPIARRRTACYCSQGLKVDLHGHILSLTDSKKGTGPLALHVKGSCFRLRSLDSRSKSCTGRFHRARAREDHSGDDERRRRRLRNWWHARGGRTAVPTCRAPRPCRRHDVLQAVHAQGNKTSKTKTHSICSRLEKLYYSLLPRAPVVELRG